MFRYFSKPIIPLLIIEAGINQQKTVNLLKKLQKIKYKNAKAIAMVIQINNHMPVQVDKIAQFLKQIRQEHKLKIYGFSHSRISAESYYLLSIADQLYTMPSSILQFQGRSKTFSMEQLLEKNHIVNNIYKSDQNLLGTGIDNITSANTSKYVNSKGCELSQRLYKESISNRVNKNKNLVFDSSLPDILIGSEALSKGYFDKFGSYYDILKSQYPQCQLRHVKLKQKISTRKLQLLIASPIIIILFLFKVLLKYTILVYLWINHKQKKKSTNK